MLKTHRKLYSKILILSISVFLMSLALVPAIESRLGIDQYDRMRQITGLTAILGALHFGYYDGVISLFQKSGHYLASKDENILICLFTIIFSMFFAELIGTTYFNSIVLVFAVLYGSKTAVVLSITSKDYYQSYLNALTLVFTLLGCFFFNNVVVILVVSQLIMILLRFLLMSSIKIKREYKKLSPLIFTKEGFPIYLSGFLMVVMLNFERVLLPIILENSANYSISNTLSTSMIGIIAVLGTRLFLDFDEKHLHRLIRFSTIVSVFWILVIMFIIHFGGRVVVWNYDLYAGPFVILTYAIEWIVLWLPILRRRRKPQVFIFIITTLFVVAVASIIVESYDFVLSAVVMRLAMQLCSYIWFKEVFRQNLVVLTGLMLLYLTEYYV